MIHLFTFLTVVIFCTEAVAWSQLSSQVMTSTPLRAASMGGDTNASSQDDIAVIGCGVLGTSLCRQLLSSSSLSKRRIVGITRTTNNHASIVASIQTALSASSSTSSFEVATYHDLVATGRKYQNVVFCAPPSGFEDYPTAVQDAMKDIWMGPSSGRFIFTSSGGVYGSGSDGEIVSETSPVADLSLNPRAGRLIKAEQVCIENGGSVLRLAGLYLLDRGAHNYWLEGGLKAIGGREDGIINLLHYDDAAGACAAALSQKIEIVRGKTFLISDGNPTTRKGICESALKATRYQGRAIPPFEPGPDTSKGKVYDGSWSNAQLDWRPVYPSFDYFMTHSV